MDKIRDLRSARIITSNLLWESQKEDASQERIDRLKRKIKLIDEEIQALSRENWARRKEFLLSANKAIGRSGWMFAAVCGLFVFTLTQVKEILTHKTIDTNQSASTTNPSIQNAEADSLEAARLKAYGECMKGAGIAAGGNGMAMPISINCEKILSR